METWLIFLLAAVVPIAVSVYYIFTGKNRKKPYYKKTDKRWKQNSPTDIDILKYTVYLIGDAGAPSLIHPDENLDLLRSQMLKSGKKSAVFFFRRQYLSQRYASVQRCLA